MNTFFIVFSGVQVSIFVNVVFKNSDFRCNYLFKSGTWTFRYGDFELDNSTEL